jgi:ribokinase
MLLEGLRSDGVQCEPVQNVAQPTGTALITVDAQGANTIVVISGANMACDAELVKRALASVDGPGVLLLQHEIPDAANACAIRTAHAAGWFIVLNPAPARAIWPELLPLIDLVVPNETEAAALSGANDPQTAAEYLLAQGAPAVLVTLGDSGALYRSGNTGWRCPAVAVQAVDTTAAGDAYIGALAAALADGRGVPDSLGFAAAAAGLAVTRLGAQPSLGTRQAVAEFIACYGPPRAVAV